MLKRLLFLALATALPSVALANDAGAAVAQAINAFFDTAGGIAGKQIFREDGQWLLWALTVIALAWTGIWSVLGEGGFPEASAKLVKVIMTFAIASFLMQADTQQALVKGFDYFAAKAGAATGSPVDMNDPAQGIQTVLAAGFETAKNLWKSAPEAEEQKSWLNQLASEGVLQVLMGTLYEGLAKILIMVVIVLTLAIYVFVVATAMVLTQFSLALAPLFVPWLMWEATSWVFQGWLRFVCTAGLIKVVAALNIGLSWGLLNAVKDLANTAGSTAVFDEFVYMAALALCLLMAFLMLQTYSIAAGLVSGTPGMSMPSLRRAATPKGGGGGGKPPPSPSK